MEGCQVTQQTFRQVVGIAAEFNARLQAQQRNMHPAKADLDQWSVIDEGPGAPVAVQALLPAAIEPTIQAPVRAAKVPAGREVRQVSHIKGRDDLFGNVKSVVSGGRIPVVLGHRHADAQLRIFQPSHVEIQDQYSKLVSERGLWLRPRCLITRKVLVPDAIAKGRDLRVI